MKQTNIYQLRLGIALLAIPAVWAPEGLAHLGYVDGKNIKFMVEDTSGNATDPAPRIAKLLSAKPDVLFTVSTEYSRAAQRATSTVPIVFAWVADPVKGGVIDSFPYSKSNLTGVTSIGDSLAGKRLEVLLEIAPNAKRILVLVATKESIAVSSFQSLQPAAQKFGVQLNRRDVTNKDEIIKALEETPQGSVDAIFHLPSNLVRVNMDLLVKKATREKIPLAVNQDTLLESGALISYGPNLRLVGIQAATLVNKILKGTRPGEIMVENPDRFFLAINQTAAKQIGLKIPRVMLERADLLIR